MAMTSLAANEALATDRQCRLQTEAVRQRRISEAEQAMNAAMRQVRYRDAALVALVLLFALLAFSLEEDTETRRIRSNIVDPVDVVLAEPAAAEQGIPTS